MSMPTFNEVLGALVDLREITGPATDDATCHYGITTRKKCARCRKIDKAQRIIDRIVRGTR